MSVEEMKEEIANRISHLNEPQLKAIVEIIRKVDNDKSDSDIQSIFEEAAAKYGNVLQKLAQ